MSLSVKTWEVDRLDSTVSQHDLKKPRHISAQLFLSVFSTEGRSVVLVSSGSGLGLTGLRIGCGSRWFTHRIHVYPTWKTHEKATKM